MGVQRRYFLLTLFKKNHKYNWTIQLHSTHVSDPIAIRNILLKVQAIRPIEAKLWEKHHSGEKNKSLWYRGFIVYFQKEGTHSLDKEAKELKMARFFKTTDPELEALIAAHSHTAMLAELGHGAGRGARSASCFRVRVAGLGQDSSPAAWTWVL